jgi:uncharacterized protein CbrC (UPF0167 family)
MTINTNGLGLNSVKDLHDLLYFWCGKRGGISAQMNGFTDDANALIDAFAETGSEIALSVKKYGYRCSDKQAWAIAYGAVEHDLIAFVEASSKDDAGELTDEEEELVRRAEIKIYGHELSSK